MAAQQQRPWRHTRVAAPVIGIGLVALAALGTASISGASASAPPSAPPLPSSTPRAERPAPTPPVIAAAPDHSGSGLHRFSASIGDDLSASLRRAGVPAAAAREYVAQMLRVEKFAAELSVADRFDLVVADLPGEGAVLVYAGMDRVGRADLQFLKYGDEQGRVEWVDARGLERRGSAGFELPVGGRITSGFGTRMHPLLGYARFHRGIDVAAVSGTAIRAAADGRVSYAGWRGGYGRQVALAHEGGLATSYSHMSRILAHPGDSVRRGQVIGFVGSSGLSTGPHLHFEASKGGRPIDPRSARIEAPVALSEAQRDAFNGQLRSVLMGI